jgi:hypothetical protein
VFTLEPTGFGRDQTLKLEVYTMLGKMIQSDNIVGAQKHQFNLGDVPNGIYLVRIRHGKHVEMIKLVKQ